MTKSKLCKICGSEATFAFNGRWPMRNGQSHTFPYYRCSQCNFLYTDYIDSWSDEQVSRLYDDSFWSNDSAEHRARLPFDKVNLAKVIVPNPKKILDIGSGEGWGVCTLRKAGFEAYGYDIVPPKMCHEYIKVGSRESITGQYDIVTAIEVLEHLGDPLETCQWIASLVRLGGVFVFSTSTFEPNKHDANWWYLNFVGHVSLHSRSSLHRLAEATGFRVVADVFSTHVWVRGDQVPAGAALQIKTNHLLKKLFDPESYTIMWERMKAK